MPQTLNPFLSRSMYEFFHGTYGDRRAEDAMNEFNQYMQNTPGVQDTFNKSVSPIRDILMNTMNNGIPELQKMKSSAFNKIKNSTARNVRSIRENVDPMLLKTMGQSAFNDVYKSEEDAITNSEMGFNQLQLQYKDRAIQQLLGISEAESNAMMQDRNYQMNLASMAEGSRQYNSQADIQSQFDWGSALGGLLQGAGMALGGL